MSITVIRTFIMYALTIFAVRFMGKRQIGQMQPTELVTTILISNIATMTIENMEEPLLMGAVPILFLISFDVILSVAVLKSKKFKSFLSGTPQIIINNGVVDKEKLKALRISEDDVLEGLRQLSIFNISDVKFAIVETNGTISALEKQKGKKQ